MSSTPQISIIIPTWNNLKMLKLCLRSIAEHSEFEHEIVLHINDGSDGTYDWARQNRILYTQTNENAGICHAMNLAAQACSGEYLIYLNDDMYVLPGWDRSLVQRAAETADREPTYVSGTMVQARSIAPSVVVADYGDDPDAFQEQQLLNDFRNGNITSPDWNGATWPPSCIHRKWWNLVGGYSIEFSPGFYSDMDFSMKLWQIGCRHFVGSGASLVYHFGEKTTSQIRGPKKCNVRDARRLFLRKWGVLPTTFKRYYLRCGQPYHGAVGEAEWRSNWWERFRLFAHKVIPSRRRPMQRSICLNDANVSVATAASA